MFVIHTLFASPTLVNAHNEKTTSNQASSTLAKTTLIQKLLSRRIAPNNPNTQQTNQMKYACCKSRHHCARTGKLYTEAENYAQQTS